MASFMYGGGDGGLGSSEWDMRTYAPEKAMFESFL